MSSHPTRDDLMRYRAPAEEDAGALAVADHLLECDRCALLLVEIQEIEGLVGASRWASGGRSAGTARRGGPVKLTLVAAAVLVPVLIALLVDAPGLSPAVFAAEYETSGGVFRVAVDVTNDLLTVESIEGAQGAIEARLRSVVELRPLLALLTGRPRLDSCRLQPETYARLLRDHVRLADLDADGTPEVVLGLASEDPSVNGYLACFSLNGALEWHHRLGGDYRKGEHSYERHYGSLAIRLHDLDGDDTLEVIARTQHHNFAPTQVAVLRPVAGGVETLAELWNFGGLSGVEPVDTDGDGLDELLVVGRSNGYREGVLILLDPLALAHAPAAERVALTPIAKDGEDIRQLVNGGSPGLRGVRYFMRFPNVYGTRAALETSGGKGFNGSLGDLRVMPDDRVAAFFLGGYLFDSEGFEECRCAHLRMGYDMVMRSAALNDRYIQTRSNPRRGGWLARPIDEERSVLMQPLYWDGGAWTRIPTAVTQP